MALFNHEAHLDKARDITCHHGARE